MSFPKRWSRFKPLVLYMNEQKSLAHGTWFKASHYNLHATHHKMRWRWEISQLVVTMARISNYSLWFSFKERKVCPKLRISGNPSQWSLRIYWNLGISFDKSFRGSLHVLWRSIVPDKDYRRSWERIKLLSFTYLWSNVTFWFTPTLGFLRISDLRLYSHYSWSGRVSIRKSKLSGE
jgi:hypothetical protein